MLIIPKRLILSIALSCAIIAAHCTPATSTTHFKVFDMSCGMPDNSVNAITEDADGFIWVGTWNGLVRLDGKKADVFQADAANPNSLSGNMIRALLSTGEGLFVGTDNGIDFYSRADGLFIHSVEPLTPDTSPYKNASAASLIPVATSLPSLLTATYCAIKDATISMKPSTTSLSACHAP